MLVDVVTEKIQFIDASESLVRVDDNSMGVELFENSP